MSTRSIRFSKSPSSTPLTERLHTRASSILIQDTNTDDIESLRQDPRKYIPESLLQRFAKSPSKEGLKHIQQSIDRDYVFFNRKRACDFLTVQNVLKHVYKYQRNLLPSRLRSFQVSTTQTPFTKTLTNFTTQSPEPSPLTAKTPRRLGSRGPMSPSLKKKPFDPNLIFSEYIDVYQRLLEASETHRRIAHYNPLSSNPVFNSSGVEKNRTSRIIRNQNHKIYGIDHANITKINSIIKPKTETINHEELAESIKQEYVKTIALKKKEQKRLLMYQKEDEEAEADEKARVKKEKTKAIRRAGKYDMYEYNPVADGFFFTEPEDAELHRVLQRVLNPPPPEKDNEEAKLPVFEQKVDKPSMLKEKSKSSSKLKPKFHIPISQMRGSLAELGTNLKPSPTKSITDRKMGTFQFLTEVTSSSLPLNTEESIPVRRHVLGSPKGRTVKEEALNIIDTYYKLYEEKDQDAQICVTGSDKRKIDDLCERLDLQSTELVQEDERMKASAGKGSGRHGKGIFRKTKSVVGLTLKSGV